MDVWIRLLGKSRRKSGLISLRDSIYTSSKPGQAASVVDLREVLAELGLNLVAKLGIVRQEGLAGITALSKTAFAITEPAAALLDDIIFGSQVQNLSNVRDSFAENDVKFRLFERRSHLVLYYLDLYAVAESLVSVLDLSSPAHVHPNRRVELEGIAARRGLGIAEEHTELLAQLVDEYAAGVGL